MCHCLDKKYIPACFDNEEFWKILQQLLLTKLYVIQSNEC